MLHPFQFDVLEDALAVVRVYKLERRISLVTEVTAVGGIDSATGRRTIKGVQDKTIPFRTACKLVCLCTNRRLGAPRNVKFPGEDNFAGIVRRGLGDDTKDMHHTAQWKGQRTVVVGMGAYAVEIMRTAIERKDRSEHVTILARQLTTVLPRLLDWLGIIRPWDKELRSRAFKGGRAQQKMIVDLYTLSGAPIPKQFKPDGGTGLLSDLFHIAYYHKVCEVFRTEIKVITATSVETEDGRSLPCGVLIKSVGFHPNETTDAILGKTSMYGIGLAAPGLWVKGEPHIDNGMDTTTPLATSIFYAVPIFCKTVTRFWKKAHMTPKVLNSNPKWVRMNWFTLSEWVQSYRHLSEVDEESDLILREYIESVRARFASIATIEQLVASNILEWQYESERLIETGAPVKKRIPYPFETACFQVLEDEAPHLLRLKPEKETPPKPRAIS